MKCPYCGNEKSEVVDSRPQVDVIRRRRLCLNCGKRFTTVERLYRSPDGELIPPQKMVKLATGDDSKWNFVLLARRKVK